MEKKTIWHSGTEKPDFAECIVFYDDILRVGYYDGHFVEYISGDYFTPSKWAYLSDAVMMEQ